MSEPMWTSHGVKTISEMAKRYDVSPRTLRFYEEKGLLSPLRVGATRLYSRKDEIQLEVVQKGKRLGFSLIEIKRLACRNLEEVASDLELPPETIAAQIKILERKRVVVDAAIDELRLALTG